MALTHGYCWQTWWGGNEVLALFCVEWSFHGKGRCTRLYSCSPHDTDSVLFYLSLFGISQSYPKQLSCFVSYCKVFRRAIQNNLSWLSKYEPCGWISCLASSGMYISRMPENDVWKKQLPWESTCILGPLWLVQRNRNRSSGLNSGGSKLNISWERERERNNHCEFFCANHAMRQRDSSKVYACYSLKEVLRRGWVLSL